MTWKAKTFDPSRASAADVQAVFGVSEGRLREYIEDGLPCLPRRTNGAAHQFDCVAVHAWLQERRVEAAKRAPCSAGAELSKLRRSQRELLEARTALMQRDLIPTIESVAAWAAIRVLFTRRMGQVMDDAAGRGWHPDVLAELEASLAEALAELSVDPLADRED